MRLSIKKEMVQQLLSIIGLMIGFIIGGNIGVIISLISLILLQINGKHSIWRILFLSLLFQNAFQQAANGTSFYQMISYFDEMIELICLLFIFVDLKRKTFLSVPGERVIFIGYVGYLLIEILSTINYGKTSVTLALMDAFVSAKFIVFFIAGMRLADKYKKSFQEKIVSVNKTCRAVTIVLFVTAIHDLILPPFFERQDFRIFTYSIKLCFQHPTYLAAACLMCIVTMIVGMRYGLDNLKYIILLSIVTIFTFRNKAIAGVFVVLTIYFVYVRKKLPIRKMILIIAFFIVAYIGSSSFNMYFIAGENVPIRLKLISDGINIAKEYFPLGAGLATFGTTIAFDSKSSFYRNLGYLSGYYEGQAVGDTFWAGIFAEAGIIGMLLFTIVVIAMVYQSFKKIKVEKYSGWCMISIITYTVIASTAESAFFNPAVAMIFIIYGIATMC